jgi:phosphoglycolate phosphatase
VQRFLQYHGLLSYIDIIVDSDAPGSRSEKVRKAAEELGGAEGDVYVIGDAVSDIRAAGQAGVKSVAVTWGHQSREKLAAAEPDHLVRSPGELQRLLSGG